MAQLYPKALNALPSQHVSPQLHQSTFSLAQLAQASAANDAAEEEEEHSHASKLPGKAIPWKRIKMSHIKTGTRCWGCENPFAQKVDAETNREIFVLNQHYADWMKTVGYNEDYVFAQVAKYHKNVIVPWKELAGEECIEWTADMVRVHVKAHMVNPEQNTANSIQTCIILQEKLKNFVLREDNKGETSVDHDTFDDLLRLMQLQHKLQMKGKVS